MKIEATALFQKVPEGYIAFLAELPGANAQGATLDEARENLIEAVELIVSSQRMLLEEMLGQQSVVREQVTITAA
ncbi:MAG: type II toxin-antitoxin system HicB family antitoxin [Deltaproteobacteria bacterium]|nr:type II toxin-antitoxin system HicB family antitoxin [Deltaproteobacteria bacterium]